MVGFIDHDPIPDQPGGLIGLKQAVASFRSAFPDGEMIVNDIVADVIEAMDARGLRFVPVVRDNEIIGVLSRENIERYLKLDTMLRPAAFEPKERPSTA